MTQAETVPLVADEQRRDVMKAPDEVSAMLRLKALGWGSRLGPAGLAICESSRRTALHIGDMPVACAARDCEPACPRSCVGEVASLAAPSQDEARNSAQRHGPAIEPA